VGGIAVFDPEGKVIVIGIGVAKTVIGVDNA